MKVLCAIKNHFERNNETLLVIAYFFFLSSHPLPSPKLAFILYFLQKPSSSFCFRFQGVIFTRNFMKSMQTYHVGEGEGEGWFRSQSLIELCILGI